MEDSLCSNVVKKEPLQRRPPPLFLFQASHTTTVCCRSKLLVLFSCKPLAKLLLLQASDVDSEIEKQGTWHLKIEIGLVFEFLKQFRFKKVLKARINLELLSLNSRLILPFLAFFASYSRRGSTCNWRLLKGEGGCDSLHLPASEQQAPHPMRADGQASQSAHF
jgi:hypothetical protein